MAAKSISTSFILLILEQEKMKAIQVENKGNLFNYLKAHNYLFNFSTSIFSMNSKKIKARRNYLSAFVCQTK